ncbi:MAG TPA: c-type cytochrome [Xanthobacteraceae bacterium]|jgi:cytochrome c|nr:c-type cytochrome [Xanthobacteraceae bacterium]
MRTWVYAGVLVAASAGAALAQDVAAGEQSFSKCKPCHDVGEDAKIKLGPPLNGIDGRKSATYDGFNYSDALKGLGVTWNAASFKQWVSGPSAMAPGTRMAFSGIKDDAEIANLWAYLTQYKADGNKK